MLGINKTGHPNNEDSISNKSLTSESNNNETEATSNNAEISTVDSTNSDENLIEKEPSTNEARKTTSKSEQHYNDSGLLPSQRVTDDNQVDTLTKNFNAIDIKDTKTVLDKEPSTTSRDLKDGDATSILSQGEQCRRTNKSKKFSKQDEETYLCKDHNYGMLQRGCFYRSGMSDSFLAGVVVSPSIFLEEDICFEIDGKENLLITASKFNVSRPCKRCVSVGKDDTCRDVEHKKRGRPKLIDRAVALDAVVWGPSGKESGAPLAPKTHTASSAIAKTRVKGKYTKSVNYKMPKKTALSAKLPNNSTDAFPTQHTNLSSEPTLTRPSSYPNQEQERSSSSLSYRSHQPTTQGYQSRPLSLHSEPPLSSDHHDSFSYPSYPPPSNQVKRPQELYTSPSTSPLATVFLTMDLICARVSDESQVLWGYHPHDISHKALYSIIATEDQSKVRGLLTSIRDAVFSAVIPGSTQRLSDYSFLESSSPVFYQNRPGIMSSSAPGANEYSDVVRVCHADGASSLFSIRMYVGGGLGTDLIRGLNLEHAYVVCIMAQHTPPPAPSTFNEPPRASECNSLEVTREPLYSHTQPSRSADSLYSRQQPLQQRYPPMESLGGSRTPDKISLPPIMTGSTSTTQSSSLSSPSAPSPLSSNSSNSRPSLSLGSSAPSTPFSGSSLSSYTVPLSKPSSHSSALPSLRTGPLHTARWLFDAEPFGGSSHTGPSATSHRLPTVFAESFRSISAPMGGFGVSKYLNRSEPSPSFGNIRRHQLPLPSSLQSSQSSVSDINQRTPRSLQRDLSTSSFGASFASRSPPSMKRPLADMADSQDRNRDIDNRHQDHHQHQGSRPSIGSIASSMSLGNTTRPSYTSSIKMDLQSMPPDHPAIDPSSAGVCPIVHGSQQRERVQLAQKQSNRPVHEIGLRDDKLRSTENEKSFVCRWAKMGEQWSGCKDNGPVGHDCRSPLPTPGSSYDHDNEHRMDHESGQDRESNSSASKDYFEQEKTCPVRHHSQSPGGQSFTTEHTMGHFSPQSDERAGMMPFSTSPRSPGETYPHHKTHSSLRRTSSVGRSNFIHRSKGPVICLTGACGSVCRCSGEDEETRAVKAMDAARK
ncbi:hypothetical protein FBU30_007373, partial [Linnemannia zychae]